MSDLISRSETIRTMWDRYNSEYNDASKYDEEETKLANKIIADMQKIIEAEPTAFDVEKVVEQIELGISESIIWDMLATASKNGSLSDTSDKIVDYVIDTIKEVSESMKGEKE